MRFGDGLPIIWCHGLLGNNLNMSTLAKNTPGDHFLVDLRNHGKSFHSPNMKYNALSEDILRLMDAHKIP